MLSLDTFKKYWDNAFPTLRLKRSHFLLAVSGGVDSMVLTHLMHQVQAKCTIAHVNFQLRSVESTRDENAVRALAIRYNFPIKVHAFETQKYADTYKMGIQEAAREIRYAWFESLMKELDAVEATNSSPKPIFLLTAHHADDQVETILMQLFRGTGLHGLTGMPAYRKDALNMARPLLSFTKEEIKAYANLHQLSYVEDSSNEKNDYTRNLIRNKIIPQMEVVFPQLRENVIATSERLKEAETIVQNTVSSFWKKAKKKNKGIECISIQDWKKVSDNATYTWGLVQDYGFKPQQINEVHKLLDASNGAYIASPTHRFIKFNGVIQMVSNVSEKEHLIVYVGEGILQTRNGQLQFEMIDAATIGAIDKDVKYAYLDADKIEFPMVYRTWQSSDYFYPLGLRKKKKLAHFLGSLKLSPAIKERAAVLTIGDKIVWVVSKRIDDRFKITEHTKQVLKITFQDKL